MPVLIAIIAALVYIRTDPLVNRQRAAEQG